jgi:hypothetical protein
MTSFNPPFNTRHNYLVMKRFQSAFQHIFRGLVGRRRHQSQFIEQGETAPVDP